MDLYSRIWGTGDQVALLLHGMGSSSRTWHAVGPRLAARGYRVIAVDLPGHGHSPRSPQASVETFVDAVLGTVPPSPALTVGHSMGGLILAAAVNRLQPARAVYVDIRLAGPVPPIDRTELIAEFAADQATTTIDYLRTARPWWSEQDMLIEAEAAAQWDVETAAALWQSVRAHDFTPPTIGGKPSTPSVLVHADPSTNVSLEHLAALAALGLAVRGVAGAGHTIWYGHLEEFLTAIDDRPGLSNPSRAPWPASGDGKLAR